MGWYLIRLNKEMERFLDFYLTFRPLRPPHKRRQYPSIVTNNWLTSLMKAQDKMLEEYRTKTGKEYVWKKPKLMKLNSMKIW